MEGGAGGRGGGEEGEGAEGEVGEGGGEERAGEEGEVGGGGSRGDAASGPSAILPTSLSIQISQQGKPYAPYNAPI